MSINMEEKNTEKEPLIRVENLKKYYPIRGGVITHTTGYVHSVDGVSFSIAEGETLGLVGESGCGKSTVGRQLVETPTGGRLFYQGKDMEKLSGKEKKSVRTQLQMVFQDPYSSLNPRSIFMKFYPSRCSIMGFPIKKLSTGMLIDCWIW